MRPKVTRRTFIDPLGFNVRYGAGAMPIDFHSDPESYSGSPRNTMRTLRISEILIVGSPSTIIRSET